MAVCFSLCYTETMPKKTLQKFTDRKVVLMTSAAVFLSALYGLVRQPFLRHFTDGITLCAAVLLLAGGVINRSFGAGYSFMLARKQTGKKVSQLMEERFREEAERENPALFAGLILLVIMLVCLTPYFMAG